MTKTNDRKIVGTIRERLDSKRKLEVLAWQAGAHDRLAKHVMPTYIKSSRREPNPMAGEPDGGLESAFRGDVCYKCGMTRAEILDTKEGAHCDVGAQRRFSAPFDLAGGMIARPLDPLEDIFP